MYQLYFRTANLLLLLYPLLFIKIMTYSLAIHFFQPLLSIWATELFIAQPIVYIWQNFGILDMVYELNGTKIICIIGKFNNIKNNSKKRNSWK